MTCFWIWRTFSSLQDYVIIPIPGDTLGLIVCKDELVPVAEIAEVNIVFV
jgi:hypothetical protein